MVSAHGITELAVEAGYGAVAYLLRYGQHRGFRRAKQDGGLPDPGDIQILKRPCLYDSGEKSSEMSRA